MDNGALNGSKLGTKLHWDDVYQSELKTFEENGDEGEVWFGETASRRMIQQLPLLGISHTDPIVDLGCGNGMLLIDAWEANFSNLLGVDYSSNAIELASSVAKSKGSPAQFKVEDISDWKGDAKFRVAFDKGTYDAISLNPDNSLANRKAYINTVSKILQPNGYLIITTCNWTEAEIISHFSSHLKHSKTLPSPKFTFGGQSGNNTTTLVFQKVQPAIDS